jgi:hypothetical protein
MKMKGIIDEAGEFVRLRIEKFGTPVDLVAMVSVAIANERLRCAKIAEECDAEVKTMPSLRDQHERTRKAIAAAIRGDAALKENEEKTA